MPHRLRRLIGLLGLNLTIVDCKYMLYFGKEKGFFVLISP